MFYYMFHSFWSMFNIKYKPSSTLWFFQRGSKRLCLYVLKKIMVKINHSCINNISLQRFLFICQNYWMFSRIFMIYLFIKRKYTFKIRIFMHYWQNVRNSYIQPLINVVFDVIIVIHLNVTLPFIKLLSSHERIYKYNFW